jgi:glycosyltransferase involved in cell wall biosynthesis
MPDRKLRVLLIGSLPPPLGGGTVMMLHLAEALAARDDVDLNVVDTSGIRGHPVRGSIRFCRVIGQLVRGLRTCDVVGLHSATAGLALMGPLTCVLARLGRRPLLIRKFGGTDHRAYGGLHRVLARWALASADVYLAETLATVQAAREDGIPNVRWFPNYRPMEPLPPCSSTLRACRRFVFLSQIKVSKGIKDLIAAAERLGDEVTVDVYGPFCDGLNEDLFAPLKRATYKGVVSPDRVIDVLRSYDMLVLPTYWKGEGYPGIVLEAFSAGLPVLTTRWRSIPDIVDETCGVLVEPRDVEGLYKAMQTLVNDDEHYTRICSGVGKKRTQFDAANLAQQFVSYSRELVHHD